MLPIPVKVTCKYLCWYGWPNMYKADASHFNGIIKDQACIVLEVYNIYNISPALDISEIYIDTLFILIFFQ